MKSTMDIIFETPTHTKKDIDQTICYFCKIKFVDSKQIWENILGMRGHPECGEKHWDAPIRADFQYETDKKVIEWLITLKPLNTEFKNE